MEAKECDGIRLLDLAERCRWRALLAVIEGRFADEERYTAEADRYDAQAIAILEHVFSLNETIPEP
jgi:hypothetical protein